MQLPNLVNTFGHAMQKKHGCKVHKLTINAQFTCPNRDGFKGVGGCTFCNNESFNPNTNEPPSISSQLESGRTVVRKRTGARKYIAYFQAYTNTYAHVEHLDKMYKEVLDERDVIGLSIGTRPDCVPDATLELLAKYKDKGHEVCLELGLQTALDSTLKKVNRGHTFAEYEDAIIRAQKFGLDICTHLIIGLPGEDPADSLTTLKKVIDVGTNGLKLHPLHIVRNTHLADEWKKGNYTPLKLSEYTEIAAEIIRHTPGDVVFHRVTGTAQLDVLLAPDWCNKKWLVLNEIAANLHQFGGQGSATDTPFVSDKVYK